MSNLSAYSTLNSSFKIKRFQSSDDRDFIKALKIYNDTIPVETKTDTNEITYFLDLKEKRSREMFFFGLYYNDDIIGYIESAYLSQTKTIVLDYITLKNEFNINGIFYPLFSLFQQYFSENLIDYDYIVTEVSVRSIEENVDKESYYSRKLLQAEDFRIIDIPYPQPLLGLNNFESNFDLRLMIKSLNSIVNLKADTFKAIVKDIYYNHYLDWYKTFISDEDVAKYKIHISEQLEKIDNNLKQLETIRLNELPAGVCQHFLTKECYYHNNEISTAGFATNNKPKHLNLLWAIGIPVVIIVSVLFSSVIYSILNKYKIPSKEIAPLFTAISATFTGLLALIFSNKTKK